jgi:hypothetical protein
MDKKENVAARKLLGCQSMNKKGLIGKIFLFIGIIILIIIIIAGITAYQAYNLYKVAQKEQTGIEQDIKALSEQKDCTKIESIQTRFLNIKTEAESACKNPVIKIGVKKVLADKPMNISGQNTVISCENLNMIYNEMLHQFQQIKDICASIPSNKTNPPR